MWEHLIDTNYKYTFPVEMEVTVLSVHACSLCHISLHVIRHCIMITGSHVRRIPSTHLPDRWLCGFLMYHVSCFNLQLTELF